jgi:hypothetical protein
LPVPLLPSLTSSFTCCWSARQSVAWGGAREWAPDVQTSMFMYF